MNYYKIIKTLGCDQMIEFYEMEDFESSLKDTYPDSFIPGLSQLQANMVTFQITGIPLSRVF